MTYMKRSATCGLHVRTVSDQNYASGARYYLHDKRFAFSSVDISSSYGLTKSFASMMTFEHEVDKASEVLHSCRPELSAPEVVMKKWLVACSLAVMVPMWQGLVPGMAHVQSPSEYMLGP